MAKLIPEQDLQAIVAAVSAHPAGIAIQDILDALGEAVPRRTLQYRLKHLVDEGRLIKEGDKRWARYMPASAPADGPLRTGILRDGTVAVFAAVR